MVTTVKVNPRSGDSSAAVFMNPDANSLPIADVDKGKVLKVLGIENGFYKVSLVKNNASDPKVPAGGLAATGICIANPRTYLYKDKKRKEVICEVTNGTWVHISDPDSETGMYEVNIDVGDESVTGYLQAKYIFRSMIEET